MIAMNQPGTREHSVITALKGESDEKGGSTNIILG